jgi:SHS2 domain-containing protein
MPGSTTPGTRHTFEEHTGEVRLELSAPSCEELFAEAGYALAELMLGDIPAQATSATVQVVEIKARDKSALLVEWLNELIFRSETSKQVFTQFRIDHIDDTALKAFVRSMAPDVLKTAVKAATLHGIIVEQRLEVWHATVVLDV